LIRLSGAPPEDVLAIAKLYAEMDMFYGTPEAELDPLDVRQDQISAALFADIPTARALLAWDDGLYVSATARRNGVGRALMHGLFELATRLECSRVEWMTDTDNEDAQAFYAGLDVPVDTSKVFYRVAGDDLKRATARTR
jgi:GNAT superfamily N-acetyltransferase